MRPSTHTNPNLQGRRGLQGFCDKNAHLKRARTQVSRRGTAAARFTNRNTFGRCENCQQQGIIAVVVVFVVAVVVVVVVVVVAAAAVVVAVVDNAAEVVDNAAACE